LTEAVRVPNDFLRFDVESDQLDSRNLPQKAWKLSYRADLPAEVDEREVSLGRTIELDDAGNLETLLERLPDVRTQAVSDDTSDLVVRFIRMRR
jgi:hypothetical protein